ncbi:MAG: ATP-dependent DNA helicase RecG [Deltaproteobacteria bacterium]|nr:ATP-dependent DNA helicase RecG [Deltaproteobacteria bacterium]
MGNKDNHPAEILSTLLKPLEFASRDNFRCLSAVKNLEPLVQNLCQKALSLIQDQKSENRNQKIGVTKVDTMEIKELQGLFAGFDGLDVEEKKKRVMRGMEIIRRVQDTRYKMQDASYKIEDLKPATCDLRLGDVKEKLARLSTPIEKVKGIGPRLSTLFKKKGLHTVEDVLYFLPIRYEDRREIRKISQLRPGTREVVAGEVLAIGEVFYGKRRIFEMVVGDGSGLLKAKWFNYSLPVMKKRFKRGQSLILYGEVSVFRGQKEVIHPDVEVLEGEDLDSFKAIVPIYSQIGTLYQKTIRRIIRGIVEEYAQDVVGGLPQDLIRRYNLLEASNAIRLNHFPDTNVSPLPTPHSPLSVLGSKDWPLIDSFRDSFRGWLPRKSLVFDELFSLELGLALRRRQVGMEMGIAFDVNSRLVERLKGVLPFSLTPAQERVIEGIKRDMSSPHPMNRLLQGDVGSGKTIVALASTLIAIENGYQVAIMAPTEILAEQHYLNIHRYAELLGLRVSLLTSSIPRAEKDQALKAIKEGKVDLSLGTHALIQEDVRFKVLGLVVIDEQHRFGVIQRALLKKKGSRGRVVKGSSPSPASNPGTLEPWNPDVLVMTATPIPRTLAMTVFGDMDVSIIDELPPGRQPVATKVFRERDREKVYGIVKDEVAKGRQAYIVYPLVEESEDLELRDATRMAQHLQRDVFPHFKVGLLHGRLKGEEKERIMREFKKREIDVLVATTVIEVGIDIPNATVMMVEHAERFGLAQLHQLRGRVGRGEHKSYCLLLAYKIGSEDTYRRLKIMEETTDGFKIAEEDLKIRGPGDFLGTRQSGLPDFRIANLVEDISILQKARDEAFGLIKNDPELKSHPVLKEVLMARWKGRLELAMVG